MQYLKYYFNFGIITLTKYEIEKMTEWKEKRFSFFADPQERKAESRPTFGTLPFDRHTSQRFAKVKEPNLADPQFILYVF